MLGPPAGSAALSQLFVINSTAKVAQNSDGGVTINPVLKQPFTGTVGTFQFASPLATPVQPVFTAAINWGDGVSSVGKVVLNTANGTYSVTGAHTYGATGTFRITVTVFEGLPGTAASTLSTLLTTIYSTAIVTAGPSPIATGTAT